MYANQREYTTGGIADWDALMQGVFALWQLQGTIGKHFRDDRLQIPDARRGAIHSHAGTGTYVTVSILEKEA